MTFDPPDDPPCLVHEECDMEPCSNAELTPDSDLSPEDARDEWRDYMEWQRSLGA